MRELYQKHGVHRFSAGFNTRAFIAFFCGIAPNMPGLAAACGAKSIPKGAIYLYSQSWLVSTVISGLVYWALYAVMPFEVSPTKELYVEGVGSDADVTEIPATFDEKHG